MKATGILLLRALTSAEVLGSIPAALAHGHGDDMTMEKGEADMPLPEDEYPPTYFALPDHRAAIYGHIGLMVLAWVFLLPTGKNAFWEFPGASQLTRACYSGDVVLGSIALYVGRSICLHGGKRGWVAVGNDL